MDDWRKLTPILLVTCTVLGSIIGFSAVFTLNIAIRTIETQTEAIGILAKNLNDYKIEVQGRVTTVEVDLKNIVSRLVKVENKRGF